jgi:hypothetical protein
MRHELDCCDRTAHLGGRTKGQLHATTQAPAATHVTAPGVR